MAHLSKVLALADFESKDLTCADLPDLADLGAVAFAQHLEEVKVVFELGVGDDAHDVRFGSGGWISKIEEAKYLIVNL